MAVETLMCRNGHEWQRERTGGRKPSLCPECQGTGNRSQSHGGGPEPVAGPLEGTARGEALVRAMAPLHRLTRSDRQAQLDSILEARDYGEGKRK